MISELIDRGFLHEEIYCGDEGRQFIPVEHSGGDLLAELVKTTLDSQDWGDLQAVESEACGVLTHLFGEDITNHGECNIVYDFNIMEAFPQPENTFREVHSSTDSEDKDDISKRVGNAHAVPLTKGNNPSNPSTQLLARQSFESMVCF